MTSKAIDKEARRIQHARNKLREYDCLREKVRSGSLSLGEYKTHQCLSLINRYEYLGLKPPTTKALVKMSRADLRRLLKLSRK